MSIGKEMQGFFRIVEKLKNDMELNPLLFLFLGLKYLSFQGHSTYYLFNSIGV